VLELVEQAGLENRCTLTGTVGSNPTLSANNPCKVFILDALCGFVDHTVSFLCSIPDGRGGFAQLSAHGSILARRFLPPPAAGRHLLDREIGEPFLTLGVTRRRRSARVLRIARVPQRYIAVLHERSLLRPPIPNAISGLVLRMNPRLHGEIAHADTFDNDRSRAGIRADYMPAKPPYANFVWVQPCS
jgi:hypothetical protein